MYIELVNGIITQIYNAYRTTSLTTTGHIDGDGDGDDDDGYCGGDRTPMSHKRTLTLTHMVKNIVFKHHRKVSLSPSRSVWHFEHSIFCLFSMSRPNTLIHLNMHMDLFSVLLLFVSSILMESLPKHLCFEWDNQNINSDARRWVYNTLLYMCIELLVLCILFLFDFSFQIRLILALSILFS